MIAVCFVVLPFTYFYAEESLENDEDIDFFEADAYSDDDEDFEINSSTDAGSERIPGEKKTYKQSTKNSLSRILDKCYKALRQTVFSI